MLCRHVGPRHLGGVDCREVFFVGRGVQLLFFELVQLGLHDADVFGERTNEGIGLLTAAAGALGGFFGEGEFFLCLVDTTLAFAFRVQ